jgi:hypothetical protein
MPGIPATRRAYSAGHFLLTVDDIAATPAYLKSVEGGFMKINSSDVQHGGDLHRVKHTTTREQESFTIELGLSEVNPLTVWIAQSWNGEYQKHSGHVVHADFDYKAQLYHYFYDALIEEVAFPTLDAGSKESLMLKAKIKPERIELKPGDGARIQAPSRPTQKLMTASAFRFVLEGFDTRYVNKIEGFTIKQGIKTVNAGRTSKTQMPELVPTKIDFPDLKVHMSLSHADAIIDWYKRAVIEGESVANNETTGFIELLTADRKQVLARINLDGVGIKSFAIPKSEANQDAIKRCSFDLYVSSINFESNDARFLMVL